MTNSLQFLFGTLCLGDQQPAILVQPLHRRLAEIVARRLPLPRRPIEILCLCFGDQQQFLFGLCLEDQLEFLLDLVLGDQQRLLFGLCLENQ